MARILLLLADGFDDEEVQGVEQALTKEGHEVVLVGAKRGKTVKGAGGQERVVALEPLQVNFNASHAVVVPGGKAADALVDSSQMVNVVYSVVHKGRLAVTLGRGVRILVPVGKQKSPNPVATGNRVIEGEVLKGRRVTGDLEVREELEKAKAVWSGERVVTDGPLVTAASGKGDDLRRLMEEMLPLLPMAEQPVVSRIL
jgi:putative intracellular protease/amidase